MAYDGGFPPGLTEHANRVIDVVIANLEELAKGTQDWELRYLKRRKLLRALQLIVEIMGKVPE